jgi:SAM-dependent methyltransferase
MCVHCGALERHRFVWLYLNRKTDLFDGRTKRMLHVAPERCFEYRLKECLGGSYVTSDLLDPRAMVKMDITDIQYPDESFDVIYCSHVLEHVQDDKRAMREFYRVLKEDGWAILLVPITADMNFEDPSIVNPLERLKVFGQEDHVRRYGPDYVDRLHEAGFKVTITRVSDLFEKDNVILMGLTSASGEIYYCTK